MKTKKISSDGVDIPHPQQDKENSNNSLLETQTGQAGIEQPHANDVMMGRGDINNR